VGEAFGDPE
jgi:hypothetical protein